MANPNVCKAGPVGEALMQPWSMAEFEEVFTLPKGFTPLKGTSIRPWGWGTYYLDECEAYLREIQCLKDSLKTIKGCGRQDVKNLINKNIKLNQGQALKYCLLALWESSFLSEWFGSIYIE